MCLEQLGGCRASPLKFCLFNEVCPQARCAATDAHRDLLTKYQESSFSGVG